ncbi:AfsR/SARP family transcriptional regulator [Streptomyces sp. H10-C2]|uniref:AfsR/SARP family transcriptional regulator n=1 Tax=unclassified Streptomyces TaxID=2593676 RepID=UPI0024BA33DD|nr:MULTISPECIES: AfsR/SARP family transcriptional regulator [unclassified Streptomyces]MDJ0340907.1 AfsR/SARP family transcriptional regulator [Streptomyces sp. PH10-H1]MDJ0369861.1 AfsR/SARP family transcriptional regulator [Streptomyces sp. H10-C2]
MNNAPSVWGETMEFRVLGPVTIADENRSISPGGRRQQAVVAALLMHRNTFVPVPRLIDYVWGDDAPPSAVNSLQSYVSRFRKLLEPGPAGATRLVRSVPGGYSLHARDEQVDGVRFARLVGDGRAHLEAGQAMDAYRCLTRALRMWRGPAMAGLTGHEPLAAEIARLEELRLSAAEYQANAALALGRHEEAVAVLKGLIRECPLRERPRARLMLALYRSGRQAEALALFRTTREMLIDELGVEPGQELTRIQQLILRQDPALAAPALTVR